MHVADIRSVYRPTVGLIADYAASGTPRSDPSKTAAQAILQITHVDDPPQVCVRVNDTDPGFD
jgi:hypothetical protein